MHTHTYPIMNVSQVFLQVFLQVFALDETQY